MSRSESAGRQKSGLSVRGLSKSYRSPVLDGVQIHIDAGEILGLVGANGAGKSTLAQILAGLTSSDSGEIHLSGERYAPTSRRESKLLGVEIVFQELHLLGSLTVAENLFFDQLPIRALGAVVDRGRLDELARARLERVGLTGEIASKLVDSLGVGERQLVAFARALSERPRLLILDEPTAALTEPQAERLFVEIERVARGGAAVLYISHRLEELGRLCDQVSVLRDGRIVQSFRGPSLDREAVVAAMAPAASTEPEDPRPHLSFPSRRIALSVRNLTSGPMRHVSFDVGSGETFGIYGLVGSGRTELLRGLYGAQRGARGSFVVDGVEHLASTMTPDRAVALGVGMLAEDRKRSGLLMPSSLSDNATLGLEDRLADRWGRRRFDEELEVARQICDDYGVVRDSLNQPVRELSGGNQQKVLIGRLDSMGLKVLMLDEPTRGIDVRARLEIHRAIRRWSAQGRAIVVVMSELAEMMSVCDRIGVIAEGGLRGIFDHRSWSREQLMSASLESGIADAV